MSINLPLTTILPPKWRVLRRKNWSAAWEILPMLQVLPDKIGGFFVEELWRSVLPEPGQAVLRYDMGLIDGVNYGVDSELTEQEQIDLVGQIVRIQAAHDDGSSDDQEWRTVWVGVVEHQEDMIAPGADTLLGSRKYYCLDLLTSYTQRWAVNRHGAYVNGQNYVPAPGHPGYNVSNDCDDRVLGNRESTGIKWADAGSALPWDGDSSLSPDQYTSLKSKLFMHTHPGRGTVWNDLQVIEHVLASSRNVNSPFFYLTGSTGILTDDAANGPWKIDEDMTAWDFLVKAFDRKAGRGLAFLDWDDDSAAPDDELTVYVRINPQTNDDITLTFPGTPTAQNPTTRTVPGATTAGTAVEVDLQGDHRNISPTFTIGDRHQNVYGYVETKGEPIEVLATIDYLAGTMAARWSTADETAMDALSDDAARKAPRFDPVWQLHGLPINWLGLCSDGGQGASSVSLRCDYRCLDSGLVSLSSNLDTSPLLVKIMSDLPLYAGYTYAGATPGKYDSSTDEAAPERRSILALARGDNDRYIRIDDDPYNCSVRATGSAVEIKASGDSDAGTRLFAGSGRTNVAGLFDKNVIVLTVGLQLPHRVRMATGEQSASRKKIIHIPGIHLWLAHEKAIWDLSTTTTDSDGNAGLRNACCPSGTQAPGLLRDDRSRLAYYHAMACSWYMTQRTTATWQLKACGFLPGFYQADENGNVDDTLTNYPTLGQVVTTLTAAGQEYTINTPITKIHYTQQGNGVTTWQTDWSDLDFR